MSRSGACARRAQPTPRCRHRARPSPRTSRWPAVPEPPAAVTAAPGTTATGTPVAETPDAEPPFTDPMGDQQAAGPGGARGPTPASPPRRVARSRGGPACRPSSWPRWSRRRLEMIGRRMYSLLIPDAMQRLIDENPGVSLTITSNNPELPWELLHDGRKYLCLERMMARMPTGQTFPRRVRDLAIPSGGQKRVLPSARGLPTTCPRRSRRSTRSRRSCSRSRRWSRLPSWLARTS